jgi:hypothetical protein
VPLGASMSRKETRELTTEVMLDKMRRLRTCMTRTRLSKKHHDKKDRRNKRSVKKSRRIVRAIEEDVSEINPDYDDLLQSGADESSDEVSVTPTIPSTVLVFSQNKRVLTVARGKKDKLKSFHQDKKNQKKSQRKNKLVVNALPVEQVKEDDDKRQEQSSFQQLMQDGGREEAPPIVKEQFGALYSENESESSLQLQGKHSTAKRQDLAASSDNQFKISPDDSYINVFINTYVFGGGPMSIW